MNLFISQRDLLNRLLTKAYVSPQPVRSLHPFLESVIYKNTDSIKWPPNPLQYKTKPHQQHARDSWQHCAVFGGKESATLWTQLPPVETSEWQKADEEKREDKWRRIMDRGNHQKCQQVSQLLLCHALFSGTFWHLQDPFTKAGTARGVRIQIFLGHPC